MDPPSEDAAAARPGPSNTKPAPAPAPALTRTDSRASTSTVHARNALRRMATHETGTGVDRAADGRESGRDRLDHFDEHEHEHEHSQVDSDAASSRSTKEEKRGGDASVQRLGERSEASSSNDGDAGRPLPPENGAKPKIELQDQTNLLPVRQVLVVFFGLSLALFASMLDQTIVTTALPTLGQVFGRADIVSWTGTAFLLTSTAMQPIYGRLSDIFGRKPSLLVSCVIFFLGALGCALSQSMIMLICFRAVQGIGGGGILTLSMIIVSDIVTLEERGKYQGIIGIVVATANSCGPIVGGSLTETVGWRWCWWLTMPITALAFIIILLLLPLKHVKGTYLGKLRQIDWPGSFLTLAWAILVLIALSWAGSQHPWSSAAVLCPLLIGLALLVLFLWVELRAPLPLIPLHIFPIPTVSAGMGLSFFSGIAFYCTLYYLPTYFQVVRGASAIRSGVLILPLTCVQTVCVFVSGFITSKTGDYYYNLVAGFAIWTVGLGLLSTIGPSTSDAHLIGYQVVVGIGAGQTFQTSLVAIQAAVERRDMAIATGTRNFVRMLGGTIGLAACSSLVNNLAGQEMARRGYPEQEVNAVLRDPIGRGAGMAAEELQDLRAAFAKGVQGVFYLLIPLVGISFILTIAFVKRIPLRRADDQAKKDEAKAWVAARREKRAAGHGHGRAGSGEGAGVEAGSGSEEKRGGGGVDGDEERALEGVESRGVGRTGDATDQVRDQAR